MANSVTTPTTVTTTVVPAVVPAAGGKVASDVWNVDRVAARQGHAVPKPLAHKDVRAERVNHVPVVAAEEADQEE